MDKEGSHDHVNDVTTEKVVAKPTSKKQWSELTKKEKVTGVVTLIVMAIIAISIISAIAGVGNPDDKTTNTNSTAPVVNNTPKATPKPVATAPVKPASTIDQLWTAADKGLKSRDKINIEYDSANKLVFIDHTDENPYTAEGFVRQAYSILVLYGQEAFKVSGVDVINVQNKTKFTDAHGNENIQTGVTIEMTKAQFEQFNWKNLDHLEVDDKIAAGSNVHIIVAALRSEIDTSKLYLVLRYP